EDGIRDFHLTGVQTCALPISLGQASDQLILHLLIDHSVVEIYVNEGERVLSCFVFPKESSNLFHLFTSSGKAVIDSLDFWELDEIGRASCRERAKVYVALVGL